MLRRFRHIREPYRMVVIGCATGVVFTAGKVWPGIEVILWVLFLASMAALLYADLREPVNYDTIRVEAGAIEYVCGRRTTIIRLEDVQMLEFVREEALFPDLYGPYIESKWLIRSAGSDAAIEVMDEWPHRGLLVRAFLRSLPQFNESAARMGFRSFKEGRWLCYEKHPSSDRTPDALPERTREE